MARAVVLIVVCFVCITSVAAASPAQADPGTARRSSSWNQISSQDFIVAGTAHTGDMKRVLRELRRFRDTLARLFPESLTTSAVPTWVLVLRDVEGFQRFQPRDSRGKPMGNVGGYFTRRPDANFIVFCGPNTDAGLRAVFHEYTHYIVARNARTPLPMWLSEGLAEFYSTFRGDYRGRTRLGAVPQARASALQEQTFVPLRDIVTPPDLETMWRWEKQIGMFYAESWALVHYVIVERKNPGPYPLSTYLASLARTGSHDQAFTQAFGTDVDGMDRELRQYVRRVSVQALSFDVHVDTPGADEARPMLESDVNALEGRLLMEVGANSEAERELMAALMQQPTNTRARIALARLRLTQEREDEAVATLQQVVAAVPDDGAARYYLGTALERAWRHDEALAAFSKAIELLPGNPAPWSGLSAAALALHRDAQASAAIQNAMSVEWSPAYYWTQALEALRLGRDDVAASSMATYMKLRGTGEDSSVSPLFVGAIAAWRAGRPADADAALALAGKGDVSEPWTISVLRFLQGRLDAEVFLRIARGVGEQTEARTYVAFKLAIAGHEEEAVAHFRWVVDHGAKTYIEYDLAKNELNRLKYRAMAASAP